MTNKVGLYVTYLILSYQDVAKTRVRYDIVQKLHKEHIGFMQTPITWTREIWESHNGAKENIRLVGYDNVRIGI